MPDENPELLLNQLALNECRWPWEVRNDSRTCRLVDSRKSLILASTLGHNGLVAPETVRSIYAAMTDRYSRGFSWKTFRPSEIDTVPAVAALAERMPDRYPDSRYVGLWVRDESAPHNVTSTLDALAEIGSEMTPVSGIGFAMLVRNIVAVDNWKAHVLLVHLIEQTNTGSAEGIIFLPWQQCEQSLINTGFVSVGSPQGSLTSRIYWRDKAPDRWMQWRNVKLQKVFADALDGVSKSGLDLFRDDAALHVILEHLSFAEAQAYAHSLAKVVAAGLGDLTQEQVTVAISRASTYHKALALGASKQLWDENL